MGIDVCRPPVEVSIQLLPKQWYEAVIVIETYICFL